MKVLLIDKKKFLDWYNDDVDFTSSVIHDLLIRGECRITLDDLLNNVGYIPEWVLVDGQEYTLDEIGDVDITNVSIKFN
jgi:hypothetical protein